MRILSGFATAVALTLVTAAPVLAQADDQATRPASSTILGDSGLWFVPIGETLPKGKVSGMAARINFDRTEAITDVSDFGAMVAFGATDRIEIFGGFNFLRRIDADRRPLLGEGQPMDYPVNAGWSTGVGDVVVGAKFNVTSQSTANGAAFAIRAAAKLPTASFDDGLGTGKADFLVDGILSRELAEQLDLAGYAGLRVRGNPADYELSNGLRYGAGFGWPSRARLKLFGEATGEYYFDDTIQFTGPVIAAIGGPLSSWTVDRPLDLFVGVQYHAPNGFYAGTGVSYGVNTNKSTRPQQIFGEGSPVGFQFRLGYHPGVRPWRRRRRRRPATPAAAGQSPADGQGPLRALHGAGRPADNGHRRRE